MLGAAWRPGVHNPADGGGAGVQRFLQPGQHLRGQPSSTRQVQIIIASCFARESKLKHFHLILIALSSFLGQSGVDALPLRLL